MKRRKSKKRGCGYSSVVERHLAKVHVARSNRVTRWVKYSATFFYEIKKKMCFSSFSFIPIYWFFTLLKLKITKVKINRKMLSLLMCSKCFHFFFLEIRNRSSSLRVHSTLGWISRFCSQFVLVTSYGSSLATVRP